MSPPAAGRDGGDQHRDDTRQQPDDTQRQPDGGQPGGLTEQQLYRVVRHAVEDALLGVLGTLLLVGIAFFILIASVQVAMVGGSPVSFAAGAAGIAFAVYLAAATLGVIPSVREFL